MMTEKEARDRVRRLRDFYQDLTIYAVVNAALILIWLLMGGGAFWPIWVMVGWGVGLLLSAVNMGVVPQIQELLPFFSAEWEEDQVKHMLKEHSGHKVKPSTTSHHTVKGSVEKVESAASSAVSHVVSKLHKKPVHRKSKPSSAAKPKPKPKKVSAVKKKTSKA